MDYCIIGIHELSPFISIIISTLKVFLLNFETFTLGAGLSTYKGLMHMTNNILYATVSLI